MRRPVPRLGLTLTLLVCLGAAAPAVAAPAPDGSTSCEFGLVLSGGGARGIAHLGVLQVLEEHGIVPDCIAGASMGSIVGALYASGHSLDEIDRILRLLTWRNIYSEPHSRREQPIVHRLERQRSAIRLGIEDGIRLPAGILGDALVNRMLIEHLAPAGFAAGRDFARLPIPFRTVGTDLRTGDRIVLSKGDLARAVRSSMSVPLAYPPVEWDGALLVDGGMVDNVPVSLVRDMGATFAVAIDVSTELAPDVVPDVIGVTRRIIDLLFTANNNRFSQPADLLIRPDLGDHSFADYSGVDELIAIGRRAAEESLDRIPERFWHRDPARRLAGHQHDFGQRTVTAITVADNHYLSDHIVLREFRMKVGQELGFSDILEDLEHLNSTGLVLSSWVDAQPDGEAGVKLQVSVKEEYRDTVDVGLGYQSDDQAQALVRFEHRNLFGRGERLQVGFGASARELVGGVRLHGEEVFGNHFGYQVDLLAHDEKPKYFVDGSFVNRALFQRRHIEVTSNLPFGLNHLLSLGVRVGWIDIEERLGLYYDPTREQQRVLVGRYIWDNLNSLVMPDSGRVISAVAERNEPALGGTHGYWRLQVDYREAFRLGPMVPELRARYGYSGGDLPVSEQFRIGGPELVPGLARDQLWGDHALAGSVSLGFDPISMARLYARVGAGNAFPEFEDVSFNDLNVGFGIGATVSTPVGPFQIDYGWRDGGGSRLYFSIGWQ